MSWQDQGQAKAVQGPEEEAVEAIFDVGFGSAHWSVFWIGMANDGEESVQGPAELHGFGRCMRKGGFVNGRPAPVPSVVAQESRLLVAFLLYGSW